jgi:hypothetical protein
MCVTVYAVKFTASFLFFSYLLILVQAAGIVPFGDIADGDNLTITCFTTNGVGAGAIHVENENGAVYPEVGRPLVDPTNITVARFEYGIVRMSDSGKKFVCDNTDIGGTRSMAITLQVLCKPRVNGSLGSVSPPLTVMQIKQFFSSSVDGCPGNVTVTCLGARAPLSFVSLNGVVMPDGLRDLSKKDFNQSEDSFSVNLTCTAEQSNINSAPVTITVTATSPMPTILPHICYECFIPPIVVCLLLLLLIIILIIIAYYIWQWCKTRKSTPEKLSDEKDEEKL